ncbi:APC family permease [Specibacter cremeus]|uniref:APC family permease n=1 Tax=Specibacter cremeus TaxID=1629051 RepID=UPI000F798AB8|nr:APC family permease [Specibacter cremeus]
MSTHETGVGEHAYAKTLRWWDGFTISLSIPAALFIAMGYSMGAIGAWTAIVLAFAVALIACLQNFVYSEMAGMFGDKVGGISMYANQGWRSRTTLAGPVATFGYWFSWSSSLAIYGLQIGTLMQAQWFPDQTWTFSTGLATIGFPHVVALVVLLIGWSLNVLGMRPAMWLMYVTGILILIPIAVFAVAPFLSPDWSVANLQWTLSASGFPGWQTVIAWMFVMAWSVYGIEAVAAFVPEFRHTVRDSRIALRLAGFFVLAVYFLVPLGVGGLVPQKDIAANPVTFYLQAFNSIIPGSGWFMTICLIAGLMLMMIMTTAAGGRVLHGSAIEGLTIRQLGQLNRAKVPARAMSLDLVVNIILILFVGEAMAVIVAGIMGYLICHILSLSGFVNLRRDHPDAERPIKLGRQWVVVAGVLAAVDAVILIVGVFSAEITGYGSFKEVFIGILVLSLSVVLYFYRQLKQERRPIQWRQPGLPLGAIPNAPSRETPLVDALDAERE